MLQSLLFRSLDIIDRKAVENAIVIVYAMGGSTSQPPIPPPLSLSVLFLLLLGRLLCRERAHHALYRASRV